MPSSRIREAETELERSEVDAVIEPKSKRHCQAGSSSTSTSRSSSEDIKDMYGMLAVIGYNGNVPSGNRGRYRSTFVVEQHDKPSGVRPFRQHKATALAGSDTFKESHSVTYTLSRDNAIIMEYTTDLKHDMFQLGRSADPSIDFIIMDTVPGAQTPEQSVIQKSTVSRFSCRITIQRDPPHVAKLFAAGFDNTKNIFLGMRTAKWECDDNTMDGLTTNGVLLMHPSGEYGPGAKPGIWREISVSGDTYSLRSTRSACERGKHIPDESNVLKDGSLIDLCGATLLWRSAEGAFNMPTKDDIEKMRETINSTRPQCPVGLTTLQFPSSHSSDSKEPEQSSHYPWVYVRCGHVHGYHLWNPQQQNTSRTETRTCPVCLQAGPYVPVRLGKEPMFYMDKEPPSHAFVPCAHACSEATVRYWSQVPLPHGCHAFRAACPFCAVPLQGEDGFVRLIFASDS